MKRRDFLAGAAVAGAGVAASSFPKPAIAQSSPKIQWRCASSFPKNLDTVYGGGEEVAERVSEITDGNFQIRVFAAGEIVPGLQVLDAVQNNTIQCGHTVSYYYVGKDPTFAFDSAIPFGFNARQQMAWLYHGGGRELMQDFFKNYNITAFPAGNTGVQMAGWFRKEINTAQDLQGLKMRIAGLAGQIVSRLGVVPQQLAGGDVYPALEKGTIDATEWVGPYDDEKLGFVKVAPYYYYPGWWEGGPSVSFMVNIDEYNNLPKHYQAAIDAACAAANVSMISKYDVLNAVALKKLVASGAQLRPFSREIMDVAYKASYEVYDELAKTNANWKKIYEPWKKFRDDVQLWWRVGEITYDNYVLAQAAKR